MLQEVDALKTSGTKLSRGDSASMVIIFQFLSWFPHPRIYSCLLQLQLSGQAAIEFIRANKEAIDRCAKITKPECRGPIIHSIFSTLVNSLGYIYLHQHLDPALNKLIQFREHRKYILGDRVPFRFTFDFFKGGKEVKSFFSVIQQTSQNILLLVDHFQTNIVRTVFFSILQ